MSLKPQRWALITGVSEGGLGDALTFALLKHDFNIIATDRKIQFLDHLNKSSKITKLELDVTSETSILAAAKRVTQLTNGRLDLLINNAGYGYMMPLMDANSTDVKNNFDVNVFGLLAVTKAFFPLLREAKGTVANQCSIAGLLGGRQPFIGTYSASKAAALSLSDTLRVELSPFGIKVAALVTGDVRTKFWNHVDGGHTGLPNDSSYNPIKIQVEKMMLGKTNPPGQHSRERWANAIVQDLLQPSPPRYVRRGYLATMLWLVSWLIPVWLLDYGFMRMSGLADLKVVLKRENRKKSL